MNPTEIAGRLDEAGIRLDVLARHPLRAREYHACARQLIDAGPKAKRWLAKGRLLPFEVPGWLRRDLTELVRTGTFEALEHARAAVPEDIYRLATSELGADVARQIWKKTRATTFAELSDVVRGGFLPAIPKLGPRKRARLVAMLPAAPRGFLLTVAVDGARLVEEVLRERGAQNTQVTGAARRGEEIVDVLEILVRGIDAPAIAEALRGSDDKLLVRDLVVETRRVTCVLQGRGPLCIHVCDSATWHDTLIRTTGDDAHIRWLETRARDAGGLTRVARDARKESDVYRKLGLAEPAPELRRGATRAKAQDVIARNSLRGAFHVHTDWSDGTSSIVAMARAAKRSGYEYIGISDHSRAAPYANGLDVSRLTDQRKAISLARKEVSGIEILHGLEVDILPDGTLDLPDKALASLDFVIASVHTETKMSMDAMTSRLVRALSNPFVTILGHPTGRLLSGKSGYSFDLDAVAQAACANDTWIEINANGHRLDLSPALARRAHAHGVRFAIDPDAHSIEGLGELELGERIARRAGLPASAVMNTRGRRAMLELLKKRRRRALRAMKVTRSH